MRLDTRVWQDFVTALLGLWVIAQPWALGYQNNQTALWAHVVAGALVIVFALWANLQRTAKQT